MDPHFDQDEEEAVEHHEPSANSNCVKKKQRDKPKGILKNSNPNATYHKNRHHRRKLDELVENERPEIIPTHTHHGRHRHHHEHHKHSHRHSHHQDATTPQNDNITEEAVYNEKNSKMSKRHSHGSSKKSSSKQHRHSSHKHRSQSESNNSNGVDALHVDHDQLGGAGNNAKNDVHDDDMSNIYDSPKVPPIPVVMNSAVAELPTNQPHHDNNNCNTNGHSEVPTENHQTLSETLQKEEVVYDVPRSNPRKVVQDQKLAPKEAIYVNNPNIHVHHSHHSHTHQNQNQPETVLTNNNIQSSAENNHHEIDNTYDVPRKTTATPANVKPMPDEVFEELIAVEYDIPKIRDSLSTIEEEHQEYDVPRNCIIKTNDFEDIDPGIGRDQNSEENLYENQAYLEPDNLEISRNREKGKRLSPDHHQSNNNAIYANDSVVSSSTTFLSEFSVVSSTNTDDRSSGYRSSSSPSIQSEELYVNESAIGSMEDSASNPSNPSPDHQALITSEVITTSKEIGVGTSESLPRSSDKKKSKKDKKEKEAKRDKERAQAEAIDKEILGKKASLERPKSKAPKPPKTYFTDNNKNTSKIDLPNTVSTSERKKNFLQSIENKDTTTVSKKNNTINTNNKKKQETEVQPAQQQRYQTKDPEIQESANSNGNTTIEKKPSQKDRSVDVYHETVRQRVTRSTEAVKDVFTPDQDSNTNNNNKKAAKTKKQRAPQHPQKDINDEELPSVRELRSKFETSKSGGNKQQNDTTKKSREIASSSPPTSSSSPAKKSNKIDFKKGFNVMSSLTRRSAMSVSKSMQNLSIDSKKEADQSKKHLDDANNANNAVGESGAIIMDFSHFTFAETSDKQDSDDANVVQPSAKNQQPARNHGHIPTSDVIQAEKKIETEDPLYANIEPATPKRNSIRQSKKANKEGSDGGCLMEVQKGQQQQKQKSSRTGGESSAAKKLLQSAIQEDNDDNQNQNNENDTPGVCGLGSWNPQKTLVHLYALPDVKETNDSLHTGAPEMEGFLERLPPGKKKSTIWNSWKRQYFVAKAGLLLIFGDSSRSVLMDRIELFGGRVDYMETTMLGIQDRRGHYVVLRFRDAEEADRWHTGLSEHVSHDLAQTFVTPAAIPTAALPNDPSIFKQILVVDFGGSSVRAGIASSMPTLPQLFFPSVMAIGKGGHEDEKYFGMDAFAPEVRSRCNLVHPFAPSSNVDKYTINQIALQGFLEKIFRDLNIDPSDYEIQLVSPRPLNDRTQKQLASLLFDEFGVKAVNMAHQSIVAMYAYSAHSGIVVDLGERMDIIPIVDGYKVSAGVSRSPVGGPQMRQKLQHYLLGKNYSLTTFVDSFVVRTAIESLSYMSRNFDRELERYQRKPEKIDCILELSKNTKLEMGSERFEAVEGLFKPELWGLDQAGVHVLVHKAIRECSMDVRKEITQSIFLAGGLSMIPGFRERLELELEKLSPATKPRVHGSPYRYHASYLGATVHANSTAFKQTKLTRDEWIGASQRLPQSWNLS